MSHLRNNYIFGILEARRLIWYTLKEHPNTFYFWPHYNPMWVILKPLISKCSMMQAWHQLVPMSGHVEESETAKKLQLYATSTKTSVSTRPIGSFVTWFYKKLKWWTQFNQSEDKNICTSYIIDANVYEHFILHFWKSLFYTLHY